MIPVPEFHSIDLWHDGTVTVFVDGPTLVELAEMLFRMVDGDPTRLEVVE